LRVHGVVDRGNQARTDLTTFNRIELDFVLGGVFSFCSLAVHAGTVRDIFFQLAFAAYLGAVMHQPPNGIAGAAIALVAIFLPTFLMVVGALPFLSDLRARPGFQSALQGINAAVVGLLLAALYHRGIPVT